MLPHPPATPTPVLTPEEEVEEDRTTEVRRDYLTVLQIAAPIAAGTILIVVVVCVVGVAIGVYLKRTVEHRLRYVYLLYS